MLKGCQREMIVCETRESPLFERAYFVLRLPPKASGAVRDGDMLAEARRLIGDGNISVRERRGARRILPFLLGFLTGGGLLALIVLIIAL